MNSITVVAFVLGALAICASAISLVLRGGRRPQAKDAKGLKAGNPRCAASLRMQPASWIIAILVLVPAMSAQGHLETDTKAGDFIFKMPAGWKQLQSGNGVALVAPSAAPGTSTTIVLGTFGIVTDLQTSFTRAWDVVQKQYHAQQSGQIVSQRLPGGNDAMAVCATAADESGKQSVALFMLARNGDRSEMVLFVTNDLQPEAYAASNRELIAFLASLRFEPAGPGAGGAAGNAGWTASAGGAVPRSGSLLQPAASNPVAMPAGPGRLAGIYRAATPPGIDPTSSLDIFDPARNTPEFSYLTFFPDGRVKKGLIGLGFSEFQDESQFRHDIANGGNIAAKWGIYQIAGAGGRIVFADARLAGQQLVYGLRGETWTFTQAPGSLQIQGVTYTLLDSGNGMTLEGTYKPSGDQNQPGIQFTRDGQFVDEGILDSHTSTAIGVVGGGVGIGYGFSSPHAGRGRYRISNYGLQMNYANSQAPNSLFFIEPGTPRDNPGVLYIDNVKYQRVR